MKILWAVSSVGKGHIMRDLAIVNQLKISADSDIDWLAPDPAVKFLRDRGCHVLECSSRLAGSGKTYDKVFSGCDDEFNLMEYTRADTRLHKHDFEISAAAWKDNSYDLIVGDEAFWLLTGFASRWDKKPAPFVFLTDFIGTKSMRSRPGDQFTAWFNNLKFSFSHMGPDLYLYVGYADEIPDERMGLMLPNRRKWARRHCRCVKPVIGFDPDAIPDKQTIRKNLGLPEDATLFLATVGPEGDYRQRVAVIEQVFDLLKKDVSNGYFMITCPEPGSTSWIHFHSFLENLYLYFAASDVVITQSGYGKVAELSALGIPFLAVPLDFHFEQEYVMAHRLDYYGVGELITLRDHTPGQIAAAVARLMKKQPEKIEVDTGKEIADIIVKQCC